MDYSKLSDFEINCDVANALGMARHLFFPGNEDEFDGEASLNERGPIWQTRELRVKGYRPSNGNCFNPCNNPTDAWPIIAEHEINILWNWNEEGLHGATASPLYEYEHENALRAAMTVFLMKHG